LPKRLKATDMYTLANVRRDTVQNMSKEAITEKCCTMKYGL